MKDRLHLSMYDHALIKILQEAEEKVFTIANNAFEPPLSKIPLDNQELRHARLGEAWLHHLAHRLETFFREDFHNDNIFGFPLNPARNNRPVAGQNPLLYDITIGEYYSYKSNHDHQTYWFQAQPIWQIESAFSDDVSEITRDFSKLISGNATFQMMVVSGKDEAKTAYLTDMAQLAVHCYSELYFLMLDPLSNWYHGNSVTIGWELFKWADPKWYLVGSSDVE